MMPYRNVKKETVSFKMTVRNAIFNFPGDIKRTIREIERTYLEIDSAETAALFNITCID